MYNICGSGSEASGLSLILTHLMPFPPIDGVTELSGCPWVKKLLMFAFVVIDGDDYIAARDPLGIKPLYYFNDGNKIVFASVEIDFN